MKKIMIIALLLLSVLIIGAVSAADNATDSNSLEKHNDEISEEIIGNTGNDVLSSAKDYDIYDFNALHSALTSDEYSQVTVNIKSNIKLMGNTSVSGSITSLVINGNEKTVSGNGHYQFLYLKNTSLTLKGLKIKNCGALNGAAIECEGDYLSITGCTFLNCIAYPDMDEDYAVKNAVSLKIYGGAICLKGNHATISNNIFQGNKVLTYFSSFKDIGLYGGAIYNSGDNVTIANNLFKWNEATNHNIIAYGGAIYNCANNVRMTGNEFDENIGDNGGAIFNAGENCIISKNIFKYNDAFKKGNAIYNSGNYVSIESNTFKRNTNYNKEDKVIQSNGKDTEISNNKYVYTVKSSAGTISNYGDGVKIKDNIIDDKIETTIYAPKAVRYGDDLNIYLSDYEGESLSGVKVTVKLNGASKKYKTNGDGKIKISTEGLKPGKYSMTIKFKGTASCAESSLKFELNVKKAMPKIIAKSKAFKKKSPKKYEITLKDRAGKAMKKTKVTLKIAKKSYKAKTNSKGKATFSIKLNKKGKYKATITSSPDKYYDQASKKVSIIVR
ncbi:hypothetical protein [Methanobrevibacter sp.]|uniref:hypothetical protein n=1 Tax=Methanobrevibacter sp. TaxID=66852 RepID=UPI00386427B1